MPATFARLDLRVPGVSIDLASTGLAAERPLHCLNPAKF